MNTKPICVAALISAFAYGPAVSATLTCNAPAQNTCTEFTYSQASETAGFQEHCQSTGGSIVEGSTCTIGPSCTKAIQSGTVKTFAYNLPVSDVQSHCTDAEGTFDAG